MPISPRDATSSRRAAGASLSIFAAILPDAVTTPAAICRDELRAIQLAYISRAAPLGAE